MNMTLDLLGSAIIGGIILLGIITYQLSINQNSQNIVLNEVTQISATSLNQAIESDFNRMGYRVESGSKITQLSTSALVFRGDLNNDGIIDTISYSFGKASQGMEVTRRCSTDPTKSWKLVVASFTYRCFDSLGNVTTTATNVRSVAVNVVTQDNITQPSSTNNQSTSRSLNIIGSCPSNATGSSWFRQFRPKNL